MRKRMLKDLSDWEAQVGKDAHADIRKSIQAAGSAARLGLPSTDTMVKSIEDSILRVILQKYGLTEVELETWLRELWEKGIKVGVDQVRDDAGYGSTAIPDKATSILAQKELKLSERLGAPREEVRKQLSRSLNALFQGEADFKQVIEAAREGIKTAANNSARRAQTIARTETGSVVQGAKQAWAEENGVTHMQWVSARVEETRDTHAAEDGNITRVNDPFPVTGLLYPKDAAGPAEEVINCLCDMVPVPPEVAERYQRRR
jgi:SPP1 gp7 family putative phage head morphogenesis protein